jgi:hypothetical protein
MAPLRAGVIALAFLMAPGTVAQPAAPPVFRFETDDFWLNLHHFLYVLGRAELNTRDSQRRAVILAPADQESELARLSESERQIWRDAVRFYASSLSGKDAVVDDALPALTKALADADDAASLAGVAIDTAVARTLERAASVYRKSWWTEQRTANRKWQSDVQRLVDSHGTAVLDFITRAYGLEWPEQGYPVHVSGYANWAGAYSTRGDLLVVSSLDSANQNNTALETLFHEAMHQWDSQAFELVRDHARALGVRVPRNLTHGLIFMTAGEAVRREFPGHVPYAEAGGVWNRSWGELRDALLETWLPYLRGQGTRDEALLALVKRVTATPPARR